jgi:dTDP-4-dehydrorhamnose reductase
MRSAVDPSTPPIEVWAGVECTVNRVGDRYFDQSEMTGHARRVEDIDLLADLGVTAVRYPVLWERIAPDGLERADWRWTDERLERLRGRGVEPIAGLLHHGSGPLTTSLLDDRLPERLAEFARAVAQRYPWLRRFTPVNEPLTTGRFSALYGHWYPHAHDDRSFIRAVLVQCRATVLAMRAIREVIPEAVLIQTEDLGHTSSTPLLEYQAAFENERRWLSLDLLCGHIDAAHPLWRWLTRNGADDAELRWFADAAQGGETPGIIGMNYYLTSERYLDEHIDRYPAQYTGGNGRHAYADVEVVRVHRQELMGHQSVLEQAWERYGLPVALTEVHLGCTRDEQLRWLMRAWDGAHEARASGVDVRAITPWAAFGSMDWSSLVTQANGDYEPGLFDARSVPPRPTALALALAQLARGERPIHPVLAEPGWWERPERFHYGEPPVMTGRE